MSYWRNTVSPMGCRSADSTRRKAGQCPGGEGCGRKRKPSGNRMDRTIKTDGDIQPERVLTSHWSSRERRKAMGNTVRTLGPPGAPNDRGSPPTIWHQIDWRKAERTVQNLRFRIFRAAKEQRWKQVRHLTTRLRRSYANVVVSVLRITQVNRGRHTP